MKPHEIKAALMLKKVSQRMIARECGVSDAHVHRVIMLCDFKTSTRVAAKIAEKIGKPLAAVFPAYVRKSDAA